MVNKNEYSKRARLRRKGILDRHTIEIRRVSPLYYDICRIRVRITVTVNSRILPPATYINYRLLSTLQRAFRGVEWQPRNYPIHVGKKEKKKRRSQSSEEKEGE